MTHRWSSTDFVLNKGFAVPAALSDLRGPRNGIIELPHYTRTLPLEARLINVEDDLERQGAYNDLLTDGLLSDLCRLVNRDLFITDWPEQWLPKVIAQTWEDRFTELKNNITLRNR
ncbi:MAG: hypothetical protein SPK00_04785 [Corynebacterium glucuronolyticum]|nr:hypothetical protein [Mycobacteriaceae bacterium]MDY5834051.1 hypothetical protein [Corynebacterium glucuronolyticum]